MAIDGIVVKTRKPTKKEVGPSISSYRNRKVPWGIVVLAGVDSDCRFTMMCARNSGGSHDCLVWDACELKQAINDGALPEQYYIVGDEAFVNTNQLLTPWSGRGLGNWKISFNFHLSAMRQCVERAFGQLIKRWGIFWRPLNCGIHFWPFIVTVFLGHTRAMCSGGISWMYMTMRAM